MEIDQPVCIASVCVPVTCAMVIVKQEQMETASTHQHIRDDVNGLRARSGYVSLSISLSSFTASLGIAVPFFGCDTTVRGAETFTDELLVDATGFTYPAKWMATLTTSFAFG
jgi:hypothetical protein